MEESRRRQSKRASLSMDNSLFPFSMSERLESPNNRNKEKTIWPCVECESTNPNQAMEFLSRSWSPSSFEFFNILSSQILSPECDDEKGGMDNELLKAWNIGKDLFHFSGSSRMTKNHNRAWLSSEKFTASTVRRHKFHGINLTSSRCIKALLTGDLFSRFLRRNQLKRKEKLRLQLAHVHAALSVARLAAAIAGVVANYSPEASKNKGRYSTIFGRVGGVWDKKMSMVVASAATLVATVCAEAAECVGAQRADIASAISQGLATHRSTEILGLTATAATCLRGASTLQLRTAASSHVSEEQMILVRGTQLSSCSITGKLQAREVKIYLKRNMITLRLVKKLLRGAISTYKEYRITGTAEERRDVGIDDGHGISSIALVTTEGTVQLLFEDLKQYLQWRSTIYHLLCIRDETNLII